MQVRRRFPAQVPGLRYLTEGGQETEIMYRHGHELPEFAMFPLLDRPAAFAALRRMYQNYFEAAASHEFAALVGGLDYRASPDWGAKLGFSATALAQMQVRCIEFLREVAQPYRDRVPAILVAGIVGPRGDAYSLNQSITAQSAEEYHGIQMATLAQVGVDCVEALTFNSVPEAIGAARAAARVNLPLGISFMLDGSSGRLRSGPTLREAIEATDQEAGDARPDFYGINCSHPFEFESALEPGDWIQRVRMLRPNASAKEKIELCQIGHLEEGDPQQLGELMGDLARRYPHIDIWGGCCGTWDKHLGEIAARVRRAAAAD